MKHSENRQVALESGMYNPIHSKSENIDEAFTLMDQNPFATVVSIVRSTSAHESSLPFISHVPLTPLRVPKSAENPSGLIAIGHLARANPHSRQLADASVTAAFQSAHAYISPAWYEENDVPTWNYSAVHISGRVELIESYDGLIECLKTLSAHAERLWPSGWEFFLPDDLKSPDVVVRSIIGFKIHIEKLDFKKKLSQTRTPGDRLGIVAGLRARGDSTSAAMADDIAKNSK